MKRVFLSSITIAILSFAQSTTIDGFSSPESVIKFKNTLFVSNVGKELKPSDRDGDGFISKLDSDGKLKELQFITGLNAPKGMAIVENILYIADVDTIKGFDINSKKEVFNLLFDGVNFLNDITPRDKNRLFVSSTDKGLIYEVNLNSRAIRKVTDLTNANGLIYENSKLYAVQLGGSRENMFDGKGKVYEIDVDSGNKTELTTFEGILDGIQLLDTKLYISDWIKFEKAGAIKVYDIKTKQESLLKAPDLFIGSADFWIDKKSKKVYMPEMMGGKVTIFDIK